jgi:hypothetical protein
MEQEVTQQAQPKVKLTDNVCCSIQTTSPAERDRIKELCYIEDLAPDLPFMMGWDLEHWMNIDLVNHTFESSVEPFYDLQILSTDVE